MNKYVITYYVNHKGGINNLMVCKVIDDRNRILVVYTGKTAKKMANTYLNKTT